MHLVDAVPKLYVAVGRGIRSLSIRDPGKRALYYDELYESEDLNER